MQISLLSHELVHVAQFECMSMNQVVERYFYEIKTFGYQKSSLEVAAYQKQI